MNTKDLIQSKIFRFTGKDILRLNRLLAFWRFEDYRIVFTNGCFDLLHPGHVDYLAKSADLGNKLIVGLNSDNSVKNLKAANRPYISEDGRAVVIASMGFVDAVVIFNENTPYELIKTVLPDILVKGSDYKIEDIAGSDIVLKNGGKVLTIDLLQGYSSTALIEKIRS